MLDTFFNEHWLDSAGNPAGGVSSGRGFAISWQNGPLGRGGERKEPNGAFVETLIKATVSRLQFYQSSRFVCDENAAAISRLEEALTHLNTRTRNREERQVEGTHGK